MSDRYCGVVVTFENDIRDDDADGLLRMFRHLHGVTDVRPIEADPTTEAVLRARIRNDMFVAMRDLLFGGSKP